MDPQENPNPPIEESTLFGAKNLYWPEGEESHDADWETMIGEDGTMTWDFWQCASEEHGTKVLPYAVYSSESGTWTRYNRKGQASESEIWEGYEPEGASAEGPMMNFWWPLSSGLRFRSEEDAAFELRHLNVCLVRVDETYGVALTGGGMDLSWDLAAAAVALGYHPWSGLSISQGGSKSTWDYGVATIGEQHARRVRASLRYRLAADRRRITYRLNSMGYWK